MKGKKIIVPVMLASLVGAPVAVLNTAVSSSAQAYDSGNTVSVVGPEIKLSGYKDKYKKGEANSIEIPTVSGIDNKYLKRTVVDPLGDEHDIASGETTYPITYTGTYSFKYSLQDGADAENPLSIATILFDQVDIYVEGDEYAIEAPTNSYHVVPSEMGYTENRKVTFPVPEVLKNDEVVTSTSEGILELVITKSGAEPIVLTNSTANYVAKDATGNNTGEAYFEYTFTSAGSYKYKYQYRVGSEVVATTSLKSFKLVDGLSLEDVELDYATLSSMPSAGGQVGTAIELPQVKVFQKGNSSKTYDAYTKVKITYIGNEPVTNREVKLEEDGFSFIPKYIGDYQVEYEISIPNNNLSVKKVKTYIIEDVVDTKGPDLYLTKSYNIADDGKVTASGDVDVTDMSADEAVRTIGDMTSAVDSYYRLSAGDDGSVRVTVPAAYVVDNHTGMSDITVTRVLYKKGNSGNTFTLVKETGEEETDTTKVAYYTFEKGGQYGAGNYVLSYTITDANNNKVEKVFDIHVKENNDLKTDWIPQITMDNSDNIPVSVANEDLPTTTITFNKSTVNDKHDGKIYDENLEVNTYYAFSNDLYTSMDDSTFNNLSKTELFLNDSDQYEAKVGSATGSYLYFVTTAKNSYNSDKTAYAFKVVKIISPNQERDNAPEFELGGAKNVGNLQEFTASNFNSALIARNKQEDGVLNSSTSYTLSDNGLTSDFKALFDQGNTVILPDMTFSDEAENMIVSVYVTYLSNDGTVNKVDITSYNRENWSANGRHYTTISNATFVADYAKMYTVTYVARDVNNYFTSRSFGIFVNDTQAPVIKVENKSKFEKNLEVGDWFNIPSAYAEDNGERDDSIKVKWKVVGATGTYETDDNRFRPLKTGTYYVVYYAEDADENYSETYKKQYAVTVVAEEDPKIELVTYAYDPEPYWDYTNQFVYFAVPKAKASDKLGTVTVGTPVVKDGNSQTVDKVEYNVVKDILTDYNESDYYFYKATSQGEYTATYTAKNDFGKSSSYPVYIKIGDCESPTLTWTDKEKDFKAEVNEGDTWKFSMSMVELKDNLDESIDEDNITITMTDPDGKTVDNGDDYSYTFNKVGSYTFKIVAKDKAGNSTLNDYSYTITVKAKDANTENKNTVLGMSPALGTTLIVLSVVVLGGVIVYFVLSSNKARKSTNAKNKNRK